MLALWPDGTIAVYDTNGRLRGTPLQDRLAGNALCALLSDGQHAAIGDYRRKTVSLDDWRIGERVWRLSGWNELSAVVASSCGRLLVSQLSGRCTELDATGKVLATLDDVYSLCASVSDEAVVLVRGTMRDAAKTLEVRSGLSGAATFSVPRRMDVFANCLLARQWFAFTAAAQRATVCFDRSGKERWRHEPEHAIMALTATADEAYVIGMTRTGPGTDGGLVTLLDSATGRVEWTRAISMDQLALEPARGALLYPTGHRVTYPDLAWHSFHWDLPVKRP